MQPSKVSMSNTISIFISSVPQRDKRLRTMLESALHPWVQQDLITIWHDEKISAGQRQEQEIIKQLQDADLILLLLSPEALASHNCYDQIIRAMERYHRDNVTVIPILLRPATWQATPCSILKPLPQNGKPIGNQRNKDLAFYQIAEELYPIILRLQNVSPQQISIYRNTIKQPLLPRFMLKRTQVVQEIYQRLTGPEVTALVLTGMGGGGKSVLAAQVYYYAEELQQAGMGTLPHKPLWITIDATVTLQDIISSLCIALERPLSHFQNSTNNDLAVELFNLLHHTSLTRLIVFDQFETCLDPQTRRVRQEYAGLGAWLDMLNSQPCSSRVLLTSRFQPHGAQQKLDLYVQTFAMQRLEQAEGAQLLHMQLPQLQETEIALAVEHCQGHMQALVLLRDLLLDNHSLSIHALLHEPSYMSQWVSDIAERLLNHIYLRYLNPIQRTLLAAFSIYREAVPLPAALAIAEASLDTSAELIGQALRVLQHHSLLEAPGDLRYQLHPVVADFVHALPSDKPAHKQTRRTLHAKAAQYYRDQFSDRLPTRQWPPHMIHALVESLWHLCQASQKQNAYALICQTDLFTYLHLQGSNSILLDVYMQLMPLHEWQPDTVLAAQIYHQMGEIYSALGQKNQALRQYKRALQCFSEVGQVTGMVEALNHIGATYRVLEQYKESFACYQEALRISVGEHERIMERGTTLNNLGKLLYEQGKREQKYKSKEQTQLCYTEALTHYEQALVLHQEYKRLGEEARTLNNMGEVYAALQQIGKAHEHYWRALACFQEYGERRGQGMVLNNLGVLYKNSGRKDIAEDHYLQALSIFRETGDLWQQGKVLRNLGYLYLLSKHGDAYERCKRCLTCFLQARDALEEIQNSHYEVLPISIEYAMREELGPQKFEQLFKEVEANAISIMEQISGHSDHLGTL